MKTKLQVINEIEKLRKVMGLKSSTEKQKDAAWISILVLQWVCMSDKKIKGISPTIFVRPDLNRVISCRDNAE